MTEANEPPKVATENLPLTKQDKVLGVLFLAAVLIPTFLFSTFCSEQRRASDHRELVASGADATATIVSLRGTGNTLNDQPEVTIHLSVQPEGAAAYRAEVVKVMDPGLTAQYTIGARLAVKYDPAKPSSVTIVSVLPPAPVVAPEAGGAQP